MSSSWGGDEGAEPPRETRGVVVVARLERITRPTIVPGGAHLGWPGDWLVRWPDGSLTIVRADELARLEG